ncbi:C-C motif chemokine 23-like isoform X1 [Canis aureus]
MKIFIAALSFFLLATALGSQIQDLHESMVAKQQHGPLIQLEAGIHRPADCCPTLTPRKIRCENMQDFFKTSSGCSRPGIIFRTKKGRLVCANPYDLEVQNCMRSLLMSGKEALLEEMRY